MSVAHVANDKNIASGSLDNIELQPASLDIWDKKYRLKTMKGEPVDEDINATYNRIALSLAEVEETGEKQTQWHGKFLWALQNGAIPAGRRRH